MAGQEKIHETCELQALKGVHDWCSREECVFWRLIEPQEIAVGNREGCGLQYLGVIGSLAPEMAEWLIETKKRLEGTDPDAVKARISFRRREQ